MVQVLLLVAGGAQNLFARHCCRTKTQLQQIYYRYTYTCCWFNITIATDNSTDTITISASGGGGGAGNSGGSDTQVQYNDGGFIWWRIVFIYNETPNTLFNKHN